MDKETINDLSISAVKYLALGVFISNSFSGYFTCQKLDQGFTRDQVEREVKQRCYEKLGVLENICYEGTSLGREIIYFTLEN